MARKGLTEFAIIVEKNNHITKDSNLLREFLRSQTHLPNKIKLTLYPFHNEFGYLAIDFKNYRDIDLSPLNNTDPTFTTCLHKSIDLCIEQILYRHEHICPCRIPEQTYILIIAETSPTSGYNITLPDNFEYKLVAHDDVNLTGIPIGTINVIRYNESTDPKMIIDQINDDLTNYRAQLIS